MLRGGPRGAMEALYELQVEEASALRAEAQSLIAEIRSVHTHILEVVKIRSTEDQRIEQLSAELRAHHVQYQDLARERIRADREFLQSDNERKAMLLTLTEQVEKADSIPARMQEILNAADVTQIHKKLADALELDIWASLARHSEDEFRRLAELAARVEQSVHSAVAQLRDANAGKPAVPPILTTGPVKDRILSFFRHHYARVLRLSTDLRDLVFVLACTCVSIAALSVAALQFYRS
ncbi:MULTISPECIES: hypothetical protein [unclassified Paraburkholderia]|uniref:hypothetical protein n=1 Tax=unclassified Paraburkholderia TaxID=2615204 RepID=UPI002AB1D2BE|nr:MULTISPECIES: hypothetical protein [unclassified Paraburkholderia]